jgi:putative intracellular protease/amidase
MFNPVTVHSPHDYDPVCKMYAIEIMITFTNFNMFRPQIYENNGIASAVCHGTAGLLNTKLSNGNYLIQNKEITGFSNIEESIVGKTNSMPFLLQDKIENRNGNYNKNFIPFTSNVVIDGRIITGQNPNSTTEVAKAILDYLNR